MRFARTMACLAIWLALSASLLAADVKTMHKEMLYPVCRVTVGEGGGSGTIVYSEDRGGGCQTYVLTNHHVVNGAIKVKKEWSSLLQADVKREFNDLVKVEVFGYAEGSRQDVCDSYRAEIVAHDSQHDLALVKLQTPRKQEHVAELLPEKETVTIFEPIWAVGCSLLHPPVQTPGSITYLDDIIDRKVYWMGNANIIYGNSGGAVFVERNKHYYFIGVPSRISVTWNQAVTHMGYFVPITRIRQWIEDECLSFLLEAEAKPEECFQQREEKRRRAEMQLFRQIKEEEPKPTPAETLETTSPTDGFRELILPGETIPKTLQRKGKPNGNL